MVTRERAAEITREMVLKTPLEFLHESDMPPRLLNGALELMRHYYVRIMHAAERHDKEFATKVGQLYGHLFLYGTGAAWHTIGKKGRVAEDISLIISEMKKGSDSTLVEDTDIYYNREEELHDAIRNSSMLLLEGCPVEGWEAVREELAYAGSQGIMYIQLAVEEQNE